jgi:hypothetical protein
MHNYVITMGGECAVDKASRFPEPLDISGDFVHGDHNWDTGGPYQFQPLQQ